MSQRTLIQKLDWVLQAIISDEYNEEIITTYDWNANELIEILEKLASDKYIKRVNVSNTNKYINTPTIEGRLFIGYEKQRVLQDEELTKIYRMEKRVESFETKMFLATLIAGIAALLLLLWQVWIWFYPVHKDYAFWFFQTIPKKSS